MVPLDVVHDAVPDSAFVPLNAAAPESVDAAVERAGQVAAQAAPGPSRPYIIPGTKKLVLPRPVRAKSEQEPEPQPQPVRKPMTKKQVMEKLAEFRAGKAAQASSSSGI